MLAGGSTAEMADAGDREWDLQCGPRASAVLTFWLSITAADGLVLVAGTLAVLHNQVVGDQLPVVFACDALEPTKLCNDSTPMLGTPVSLVERGPIRRTTSSHNSRDSTDR